MARIVLVELGVIRWCTPVFALRRMDLESIDRFRHASDLGQDVLAVLLKQAVPWPCCLVTPETVTIHGRSLRCRDAHAVNLGLVW